MEGICRTCLQIIKINTTFRYLNESQLNNQIQECVPELELDLVTDAMVCSTCIAAISLSYHFRRICLETEDQLHKYLVNKQWKCSPLDFHDLLSVSMKDVHKEHNYCQEQRYIDYSSCTSDDGDNFSGQMLSSDLDSSEQGDTSESESSEIPVKSENVSTKTEGKEKEEEMFKGFVASECGKANNLASTIKGFVDDLEKSYIELLQMQLQNSARTHGAKQETYFKHLQLLPIAKVRSDSSDKNENSTNNYVKKLRSTWSNLAREAANRNALDNDELTKSVEPKNGVLNDKTKRKYLLKDSLNNKKAKRKQPLLKSKDNNVQCDSDATESEHIKTDTDEMPQLEKITPTEANHLKTNTEEMPQLDKINSLTQDHMHTQQPKTKEAVNTNATTKIERTRQNRERSLRTSSNDTNDNEQEIDFSSLYKKIGKHYQCPRCRKRFLVISQFDDHLKSHFNENSHSCPVCQRRFVLEHHITRHLEEHRNEKFYSCRLCPKRFQKKVSLQLHMDCHNRNPFTCKVCNYLCKDIHLFRRHLYRHVLKVVQKQNDKVIELKIGETNGDEKTFSAEFKQDIKEVYSGMVLNKNLGVTLSAMKRWTRSFRRHACAFCQKQFLSKSSLDKHISMHTEEN